MKRVLVTSKKKIICNHSGNTVKPTYNDPIYNDLSVIVTIFWCTYNFPVPHIETASRYSEHFFKRPTFITNISDATATKNITHTKLKKNLRKF